MDFFTADHAAIISAIVVLAQCIGRAIPDSATGVVGVIRKIAKVLGMYMPNRT